MLAPTVKLWTITEGLSSTFGSRNMSLLRLASSQVEKEKRQAVKGDKSPAVNRSLQGKWAQGSQNYQWLTRQTKAPVYRTQVHQVSLRCECFSESHGWFVILITIYTGSRESQEPGDLYSEISSKNRKKVANEYFITITELRGKKKISLLSFEGIWHQISVTVLLLPLCTRKQLQFSSSFTKTTTCEQVFFTKTLGSN